VRSDIRLRMAYAGLWGFDAMYLYCQHRSGVRSQARSEDGTEPALAATRAASALPSSSSMVRFIPPCRAALAGPHSRAEGLEKNWNSDVEITFQPQDWSHRLRPPTRDASIRGLDKWPRGHPQKRPSPLPVFSKRQFWIPIEWDSVGLEGQSLPESTDTPENDGVISGTRRK
jgi:hypothetical protein